MDFIIRPAGVQDAPRLLEIYSYYIKETAITFEWEVPTVEEFAHRIESISQKHPYIVAETVLEDSLKTSALTNSTPPNSTPANASPRILGYAYGHAFSERKAYDWTIEPSIYVDKEARGLGLGKALYAELEKQLKAQGVKNLIAKVAWSEVEDEYLTHASVLFHEKQGYKRAGLLEKVGLKFHRWYDIAMMQKKL